jgi:hypothetical protein
MQIPKSLGWIWKYIHTETRRGGRNAVNLPVRYRSAQWAPDSLMLTPSSHFNGVRSQETCNRYGSSMAQLPAPGCYLLLATLPLLPLLPLSPSKEFRTSLVVFLRDAGEVELVGAIVSGF